VEAEAVVDSAAAAAEVVAVVVAVADPAVVEAAGDGANFRSKKRI